MRLTRMLLAPALAALGVASVLGLAPATAARADTIATIKNLTGFHQMVVDAADGYIFFSEGLNSWQILTNEPAASALVVTDLSGNYITSLETGGDGVEGIALSADGATLYAALSAKGEVAAISIASIKSGTPTQTVYSLPSPDVPYGVAAQGGKLWVSANETPVGGFLGSFDLGAPSPAFTPDPLGANWYSAPDLAADPSGDGLLVAANPGSDPTTVVALNAETGSVLGGPAFLTTAGGADACGFEQQLAVVPGTQEFAVACDQQHVFVYGATNLAAPQRSYPIAGSAGSVVAAADGAVAAGYPAAADVYLPDGTLANVLSAASDEPVDAGLVMSADGTRLYDLLDNDGTYSLRVFDNPEVTRSALTLNANPVTVPGILPVTGQLSLSTGGALPAGAAVTVTAAKAPNGTSTVASVTTAADGTFSVPEDMAAAGTYTITATYPGVTGDGIAGATASASVQVVLSAATITLSGSTAVPPVKHVSIAGQLDFAFGTPAAGTAISVRRTNPDKTVTTLPTVATSAGGAFAITDKPPATGTYTYTVGYGGSAQAAKASAAFTVRYAKLTPALTVSTVGTGSATAAYRSTIKVTAHLGAPYANHVVSLYYQLVGTAARKLLRTGTVDSGGNLTANFPSATRNVVFSAAFTGDAEYNARAVSKRVGVEVRVAMSNSGWYTSNRYSGERYRVYHHTGHLNFSVAVTPNKHGQCAELVVQELSQGVWFYNQTFGCYSLNSASKLSGYLLLTEAAGARYRIAASYDPSKSDVTNVATQGSWFYFEVVK